MQELEIKSVTVGDRRKALDAFRSLLRSSTVEADWERFFNTYPFVLAETLPVNMSKLYSQVPLSTGQADYVFMGPSKGLFGDHGVIELKRPDHPIIRRYSSQQIVPSAKLVTAYVQSRRYLDALISADSSLVPNHFVIGNRQHAFIIIGQTEDVGRKCCSDSHRLQLSGLLDPGMHVYAYDELMELYASALPRHIQVMVVSTIGSDFPGSEPYGWGGIEIDEDGYLEGTAIWIGKWK